MDNEQNEYERRKGMGKPSRWRRLKQWSAPEQTWLLELSREATPFFRERTKRHWLKALNSRNVHVRQQAKRELHDLPPAARRLLTAAAYRHAQEYIANVVVVSWFLVFALIFFAIHAGSSIAVIWATIVASSMASLTTTYLRNSRQQELAQNLLDSSDDVRLIPFLLSRLQNARVNNRAPRQTLAGRNMHNALVRLLPLVQEADTTEWTGTHWNYLLYSLRHPYADIELTLIVLQTVARVGNEAAWRAMKELTSIGANPQERVQVGRGRAAWESNKRQIEQTAQEQLPQLEARLERQRHAQTLLRAADSNAASNGEILLRPASSFGGETPAEQLLRPQNEA